MAWSALVTTVALVPVALASGEQILPHTAAGWVKLAGLALISQVAGQSLIAYAMAHLPATFSSVGLLAQPVIAAILAWILLGETLGWVEIGGALVVLVGIRIVHQAELGRRDTANASQQAR
jgi:drug/metabolite transporter (DMT)-like permease